MRRDLIDDLIDALKARDRRRFRQAVWIFVPAVVAVAIAVYSIVSSCLGQQ